MIKFVKFITYFTCFTFATLITAISGTYLYLSPDLPDARAIIDIDLQTPLKIYSHDGLLLGVFGNKRRTPIAIEDVSGTFIQAFLAAEDDRFYEHNGVSPKGLARAIVQMVTRSDTQTGGSTITMQVAKNYFLTPEKTIKRKISEIFLALQIEQHLSKGDILELYVNKIFLGNRAYGIAAAAQVYYGKKTHELTLAQIAMIAGLPKAPSAINPLANPERAIERRNWILRRMHKLGYISKEEYHAAREEPVTARKYQVAIELDAPYIAELARQKTIATVGPDATTKGYKVITTINSRMQIAALGALQQGLETYDQRHGYRGPEENLEEINEETLESLFNRTPAIAGKEAAVITRIDDKSLFVQVETGETLEVPWENGLEGLEPYINEDRTGEAITSANDIFKPGDVIRIIRDKTSVKESSLNNEGDDPKPEKEEDVIATGKAWLSQVPKAESALVSIDSNSGAIKALVGGYDFNKSKFNRATQARRQIGSNIKPFIYSAALENNYTAATMINDAPIVQGTWRPKNSGDTFLGPIRLRKALYLSRNLVSIRLLRDLGIENTRTYLTRFGFDKTQLPADLSLSLGSSSFTPLKVAEAYSVFANGGYKVSPYMIEQIIDRHGKPVYQADPAIVCKPCLKEKNKPEEASTEELEVNEDLSIEELTGEKETKPPRLAHQAIPESVAFIMDSMLKDVVIRGTATKARSLGRKDIAGKTGTTNGPTDAWFSGYGGDLTTTVWLGFNDNSPLGQREFGGSAALPIWIAYMEEALRGTDEKQVQPPESVVSVLINKDTGKRAQPGDNNSMFEYIRNHMLPSLEAADENLEETPEQLEDIF